MTTIRELPVPDLADAEPRWVDAGGVRLHIAELGTGEPVVLLHGFPQLLRSCGHPETSSHAFSNPSVPSEAIHKYLDDADAPR